MVVLCAGAAKGLVEALRDRFERESGATIDATFGAVGALKETFLAGAPCDAIALTQRMLEELAREGHVVADTVVPLGRVYTGVAVRAGDADPPIGSPDGMRDALAAATSVYFPDPDRATAGIHFMRVLDALGVRDALAPKLRPYPNGATAMAALASAADARPIGCTQVTEIVYTQGVRLVGRLPQAFELATVYAMAVATRAARPSLARRFIALATGPQSEALRRSGGFE
jgi:molybdate transport system substrate-binding protein